MQKRLLIGIYLVLFFINSGFSQDVSLPLGPFRDYLITKYPGCFVNQDLDGNLMLNTSCTAITTEDSLVFHNIGNGAAIYLSGIQYFTSLVYLDCSSNQIISSPTLPASLRYLNFSNTLADRPFGSIPNFLPNQLRHLDCSYNDASSLGTTHLPDSLRYFNCAHNILSNLPALPSKLDTLICGGQRGISPSTNVLNSLPVLPSTLKYLNLSGHRLSALPTLPTGLKYLDCSSGNINTNPENISFTLHSLPALPDSLQYLNCSANGITQLPQLPARLTYLNCSTTIYQNYSAPPTGTGLTDLPELPAGLTYLNCSGGMVYCIPHIPSTLTTLWLDRDKVTCLPNTGNYTVSPSGGTLPLCNVTNNSHQCISAPLVSGNFFYDLNNNNVKDANEPWRSGVGVHLQNGNNGFSNNNGYFELSGDLGSNMLTTDVVPFYNVLPSTVSFQFAGYDTAVNHTFALQQNVTADSIRVSVVLMNAARPGFPLHYQMKVENIGTTTNTANISFAFDAARLIYNAATGGGFIQNGNQLSTIEAGFSPGTIKTYTIDFTTRTTAVLGDTLWAKATGQLGSSIMTDSIYSVVRGSFDPNNKKATPSLSLQQVARGNYIHYQINFQNTGTASAINIVITDQLNALLDLNSVQLLTSSHPCRIRITGNLLSFEFLGINLPDSNSNEPLSHGYVQFRVKPITSVVANTVIPNKANIYFDYNSPIVTNMPQTLIQLGTVATRLTHFSAKINDANSKVIINWEMADEQGILGYQIQQSEDGIHFSDIELVPAQNKDFASYSIQANHSGPVAFYRVKWMDMSGRNYFSKIIRIESASNDRYFKIVQNPVVNFLLLEVKELFPDNNIAEIYNASSQKVKLIRLSKGNQKIDLSRLLPGLYFIKYGNLTSSFIKTR